MLHIFRRLRPVAAPAFRRRMQSTDVPKLVANQNAQHTDKGSDSQKEEPGYATAEIMDLFWEDRYKERTYWEKDRTRMEAKIDQMHTETLRSVLASQVYIWKISELLIEVHRTQNNLNLRSGLKIIAEVLRIRAKPTVASLHLPLDVQSVLDEIPRRSIDSDGRVVRYADAHAAVAAAFLAGGDRVTQKDAAQALGTLYEEVSNHYHEGSTVPIKIRHGEQTMAEAVAAMSVFFFARQLFGCRLDAVYIDAAGKRIEVSHLEHLHNLKAHDLDNH
ncbi:hypothetical protein B0H19DRAFT_1089693 [Mycena capillaripes]|nr:hypothetical protein B0H19DRAFT_1089693 [Mycena capillaripes]